jgi:Protein of unknown function (DUF2508).
MDNKKSRSYFMSRKDYTKEQKTIIEAIEEALLQLQVARENFEHATDPRLIDYTIFMEEATKAKLVFLLSEAKKLDVKVDCSYNIAETRAM